MGFLRGLFSSGPVTDWSDIVAAERAKAKREGRVAVDRYKYDKQLFDNFRRQHEATIRTYLGEIARLENKYTNGKKIALYDPEQYYWVGMRDKTRKSHREEWNNRISEKWLVGYTYYDEFTTWEPTVTVEYRVTSQEDGDTILATVRTGKDYSNEVSCDGSEFSSTWLKEQLTPIMQKIVSIGERNKRR